MKTTISLLLTITLFVQLYAQDEIPNAGFESWTDIYSPADWNTTNDLLPPGVFNVNQSTIVNSGSFAASLKTIDLNGIWVPGVLSLGTIDFGFSYGGIPFNEKPEAFNVNVLHPSVGDEVMVGIELLKNGETIGGAFWSTTDSIGEFQQITIPINYINNEIPDTLNITFLTDQFYVGSNLIVDDLSFEYASTNINLHQKELEIVAYPNPFEDKLIIENNIGKNVKIQVINLLGKTILNTSSSELQTEINTVDFEPGYYFITVSAGSIVVTKKVVKQ